MDGGAEKDIASVSRREVFKGGGQIVVSEVRLRKGVARLEVSDEKAKAARVNSLQTTNHNYHFRYFQEMQSRDESPPSLVLALSIVLPALSPRQCIYDGLKVV